MQHNEYDESKRRIVSEISTLSYGKSLYTNRYFALMQILDYQWYSKEPIFLKRGVRSPKEYERRMTMGEELDMILENNYGLFSSFDKFISLRDSNALRLLHTMSLDEDEMTIEEVSWSHKFDFAMDKMLEGDPRYSLGTFRVHLMYDESSGVREYLGSFDHEKLRHYLEAGGLVKSRARMNKLTPTKSPSKNQ